MQVSHKNDSVLLVPMVVSLHCLEKDKLCSDMLFFNKHSAKFIRESVDIVLSPWILISDWILDSLERKDKKGVGHIGNGEGLSKERGGTQGH